MFWKLLNVQQRVIRALIIREIYSRFGREGLGFAWIIAEPLMFALPVLLLWSVVRAKYDRGVKLMPLTITGYLAVLLFRHLCGSMIFFIRANHSLLYHQQVTLIDIFLARAFVEIASNILALCVTFIFFIELGEMDLPVNYAMFYLGYFFMIWWCIAVALLVGAFAERSRVVEKLWPVYSYTYMFFSGFFFLADWLPPKLREVALYQPSLQAYEMIRAGMFGNTIRTYGDPAYETLVLPALPVLGLWAMREGRKHVVLA
jgi:capsular polysaccharide transport system permease protein